MADRKNIQDTGLIDYIIEPYSGLNLTKTKGKELTVYSLSASTVNGKVLDKSKGLTFTLDNGVKIQRPDLLPKLGLNSYGDYMYSGTIELTNAEIELLKTHEIKSFQIGGKEQNLRGPGEDIINSLPCLLTK